MSKLLISEQPLQVIPKLAMKIGLNEAIVLQQIHYWLVGNEAKQSQDHYHDGRWWTYNTLEEWGKNFPFWSTRTIQRVLDSLRKMGLVLTGCYNKSGYDKTLWYTIDYIEVDKLSISCRQVVVDDTDEVSTPIPETSTESNKLSQVPLTLTADDTGASAATQAPVKAQKAKRTDKPAAASEKVERPRDLLFDAIAEVCQLDPTVKTNGAQIGRAKRELTGADPPYNETHVRNFGKWWLSDDWRKRNTPIPSVPQLLQKIAQGAHYTNGDARAAPVQSQETPGQRKLRELRAKQKDRVWEA